MLYNKIANSSISISAISLGCMSLHGGVNTENIRIIEKAYDLGINYFDTADLYDFGENERLVGTALKSHRSKIYIATKVGNQWSEDKTGWTWNVSPSYIRDAVEASLLRLNTDFIDLYQIHGGTKEDNFDDVVGVMEDLISEGKIRHYGISSIRPNVFLRFANESNIVSNMMQYSLLDTRPEQYFDALDEKVSVLARGVFAQGKLLGKPVDSYLQHSNDDVQGILTTVKNLSNTYDVSQEAVALAYVLSHKIVASCVVGVSNEKQLKELELALSELENKAITFEQAQIPTINYREHIL